MNLQEVADSSESVATINHEHRVNALTGLYQKGRDC